MGKKRSRSTAGAKPADGPADGNLQHAQSLVDEVREVRDVEFAAEKKQEARAKRVKLFEEQEISAAKKEARALKKSGSKRNAPHRVDAKKAGFEVWKKAALRRKARATLKAARDADDENLEEDAVDAKTTAKIFKEAREQRAEIQEENLNAAAENAARNSASMSSKLHGVGEKASEKKQTLSDSDDDSEDDMRSAAGTDGFDLRDEKELQFLDGSKITEEDELALAMFSTMEKKTKNGEGDDSDEEEKDGAPRIMLADIILQKIREKEEADAAAAAIAADPERAERDRKIAEVYGLVGNILSRYRSGKVPKAFKVIPKLRNWEEILYLTRPDEWTPAAVFVATRLLASNLPAKEVVRFYTDILLPRCLEDISENKKLNYHLYRALGRAVYKPDAFNKGILFPLCEDYGCTLRQATIIGSVVSKVSIPMLHSAAALLYICQLPYSPPNSIVITALLEKKYALPYRVLDAVVDSFLKMKADTRPLPLVWHHSLLAFAQRYKMEVTMEQKEKLKLLMRVHTHHGVTPEIRRELFSARNRGDLMDPDANTIARQMASAMVV